MEKEVTCICCNRKLVKVTVYFETGYISVDAGEARITGFSDGTQTVDFYCDKCKEEV